MKRAETGDFQQPLVDHKNGYNFSLTMPRRAIAGMTRSANGSVQVKLHGKVRALEMLAKHLGMYEIRREPTSRVGDVCLLTDEELTQIIREERAAKAASDGQNGDGKTSNPG